MRFVKRWRFNLNRIRRQIRLVSSSCQRATPQGAIATFRQIKDYEGFRLSSVAMVEHALGMQQSRNRRSTSWWRRTRRFSRMKSRKPTRGATKRTKHSTGQLRTPLCGNAQIGSRLGREIVSVSKCQLA